MDLKTFTQKKICVAISGGVDSVALLHYLKSQEKACGYFLSAVHCEHGIRGEESVEDMRFVQEFCKGLGVELYVFKADCLLRAQQEKRSVETAARAFRMESFAQLIQDGKADFIATAHHQDDEAETVLFRIARGAALAGAGGMSEKDGFLIRPFLRWPKADILAYAKEQGLSYRVDKTNLQTEYTRNKLRLEIFPALENAVPGAMENFARFAALAAEDDEFLYEQSASLVQKKDDTVCVAFCDKKPLFCRACLTAMKAMGIEHDYTSAHIESVYALQNKERGARVDLPRGITAQKMQTGILFSVFEKEDCALPTDQVAPFGVSGFDAGMYAVKCSATPIMAENDETVLRVDKDKIPPTAVFRFRRDGDGIRKFGGGYKTLKKFFNEKKIPPTKRRWLPLIAEEYSGEVYAICGVEIADSVKVDENTKNILYIQLIQKRND
jgi:tRNA(Ile)-lysidine synthase